MSNEARNGTNGGGLKIEAVSPPAEQALRTSGATNSGSPIKASLRPPVSASTEKRSIGQPPSNSLKKQKTSPIQTNGPMDIDTSQRMEILALYKEALIRREEACRELERLEHDAAASNIPLFEDYAKDPVYLPSLQLPPTAGSNPAASGGAKTITPLGLNGDLRKLEQFFPPSNPTASGGGATSVAQVVQQAAQAPSLLQQMHMLQDQQHLQHQYAAAQSLAVQQQAAVQQLHQHQQHGLYQAAAQSVYGAAPLARPTAAAQTDPSLLLLAAQYQQSSNSAAPGVGAMYLPAATGYAPGAATAPGTALSMAGVAPVSGASHLGDAMNLVAPPPANGHESRSSPDRVPTATV